MIVGHYSVSFAVKALRKDIPLWQLLVAVQAIDFVWAFLILAGVEKMRIDATLPSVPLDLYYMPYSHSLMGALIGFAVALLAYRWWLAPSKGMAAALLVALAVFSHWALDVIVHRPDLPLYDDVYKIGLALWNLEVTAFVLEVGLLIAAMVWYHRTHPVPAGGGRTALVVTAVALALAQVGVVFAPTPGFVTPALLAGLLIVFYLVVAGLGSWLDRTRG